MSLKLNDLQEHERKLTQIIEHAEKERSAIITLINGMNLRSGSTDLFEQPRPSLTIPQAVTNQVAEFGSRGFTVKEVMNGLVHSGFRDMKAMKNIRPSISGELRKKLDSGRLKRKNVGTGNKPIYEYRNINGAA